MRNLTLVMDFYELTMSQVYFNEGKMDEEVTFDLFYRKNPDNAGYAVCAGLDQAIDLVLNFSFTADDINYLRSTNCFNEAFLEYLSNFKFKGDIYAIPEGTPVFPYEPIVRVKGNIIEAQLLETGLLLCINHETMIASKARRIVTAADGRAIMEFGARRSHNFDAAIYGARAAYIGGVAGTATAYAGKLFNMPALGTMAHSFVQSFDSELEAFKAYCNTYPNSATLLLDTYDTLHSGLPNAIRAAKEVLEPQGYRLKGVRIDSGDMAYLSKQIRKELDANGMEDCNIVISNSLDEYLIESLLAQGAKIDSMGVGENLICSKSSPVFGGVYKLSSIYKDGKFIPKIKRSENIEKITNPGYKDLYRIYDRESKMALADVMALHEEKLSEDQDLTIYHQMNTWKNKTFKAGSYYLEPLLLPIFIEGKLVYKRPNLVEIREFSEKAFKTIWEEVKRFAYPQTYYVDLTKKLSDLKHKLLLEIEEE